jgi:hypothetical protein
MRRRRMFLNSFMIVVSGLDRVNVPQSVNIVIDRSVTA